MNILTQIDQNLKQALIQKNEVEKNTLRQVKVAIQNAALNKGNVNSDISDLEIIGLIRKEIQKRKDSIAAFSSRQDLIEKEQKEIDILEQYLPTEITDAELDNLISNAITVVGAKSKKEMGQVIKFVAQQAAGRADNKTISAKVGKLLV